MALTKIPPHNTLTDKQFISITGGDGVQTSYAYDEQQRSLIFKESQVLFPSFHGMSHIAEDPIPGATCDLPGLMSEDDKCKLDSLIRTRIGVLGFQGAGFANDGGWVTGDILLAAGTEFISLERIGNVIRFTVDSPLPLSCACESCTQIFWIQDETDIASIRPPACAGKLPGINGYGELKIYVFPESTIADPNNTEATLNNKGSYPSLIFKRYDDALVPGTAEFELTLQRDANSSVLTQVGWAMTPGASGIAECVWFMGKDNAGNQITFELEPENQATLVGALVYKGHLLTKKMGVIIDYTATILSTNMYRVRYWDINTATAVGNTFNARNVWNYSNPLSTNSGPTPKTLTLDASVDLLPKGSLVDLWFFKVGESAGTPINRYFFSSRPSLNPNHLWQWVGSAQFGDMIVAREEITPDGGSEDKSAATLVSAVRDLEPSIWGLTGTEDPLLSFDIAAEDGTGGADLSTNHRASIDTALPGLRILSDDPGTGNFSQRPVWLWNRNNHQNAIIRADVGRPANGSTGPIDFILRGYIDSHTEKYARVVQKGIFNEGTHYIRVVGLSFSDLPRFGTVRVLSPESNANELYNYTRKYAFPSFLIPPDPSPTEDNTVETYNDSIVLCNGPSSNDPYPGNVGDIIELLHQDYTAPVVRIQFDIDPDTNLAQMQVLVGILDMSVPYEGDVVDDDVDDYIRGLRAGYAVSAIYSQSGRYTGVGTKPTSNPTSYVLYNGGAQVGGTQAEYWNRVEIMVRDGQVWVWWNGLLIPPSTTLSANLSTPVTISTPYFPIAVAETQPTGKYGMRMWPGTSLRRFDLRSQNSQFSEFVHGQISIA